MIVLTENSTEKGHKGLYYEGKPYIKTTVPNSYTVEQQ